MLKINSSIDRAELVKVAQLFKTLMEHQLEKDAIVFKIISGITKTKLAYNVQLKDVLYHIKKMKGKKTEKLKLKAMKNLHIT